MGVSFSRKLPHQDFRLYFSERLFFGWEELLCCPEVAGCSIRKYAEDDAYGGQVEYTVMRSVSYSPYVPRFVMEVRKRSIPRPAVVGRLEKLDTIFRAKTGEFLCVNLWKLVVNGLQWSGSKRSVIASESDMFVHHIGIVTQAKIDFDHPSDIEWILKPESERWVQSISSDHPMLAIQSRTKGKCDTPHDLTELRMKYDGILVGTVKQQKFVNSDEDLRSYLGVQMDLNKLKEKVGMVLEDEDAIEHRLPTEGLVMMLMCLAWSQSTLMTSSEHHRHWRRFTKAMRSHADEPDSGQMNGYPSEWNLMDVKKYLAQHSWWLRLHSWDTEREASKAEPEPASPSTTIPVSVDDSPH
ncbi:unnamed protein product [Durusdinium trenchii]|uniref:Uncharacterized protein n=1 Tax=Durusdinium trenchii TaxID=1381693 RepID=A0ABP0Q214_9DINO